MESRFGVRLGSSHWCDVRRTTCEGFVAPAGASRAADVRAPSSAYDAAPSSRAAVVTAIVSRIRGGRLEAVVFSCPPSTLTYERDVRG